MKLHNRSPQKREANLKRQFQRQCQILPQTTETPKDSVALCTQFRVKKMEQLYTLENEIKELRQKLKEKEEEMNKIRREGQGDLRAWILGQGKLDSSSEPIVQCGTLPKWAIERYSRQILLKDIGVQGQTRICQAKVLIVGAGGLGCPSAMYLVAAGVGEIGIIDYDVVEITNIHRQVLHFEQDENVSKAESAASTLRSINSRIKVTPYNLQLDSKNAMEIASQYDIILDCTDNVPTRYMLSDLSCFTKKPLISGSALKMEGQLTIYGYRSETHKDDKGVSYKGPCYRCVFPTPPSPDVVGSCSAHGVAGPVPGVIGILQAMEALKIILDMPPDKLLVERMLIFDAEDMTTRTVRLRKRNPACATCSDHPTNLQCRKEQSKDYFLHYNSENLQVCRLMFLNTLGIKEAMVRCWLAKKPIKRTKKHRFKCQDLVDYIDKLPIIDSKCHLCLNSESNVKYIDLNVKNKFHLYSMYVKEVSLKNIKPASRKTFSKVLLAKNLRMFKPKNDRDVCDLVREHNLINYPFNDDDFYRNSTLGLDLIYEGSNLDKLVGQVEESQTPVIFICRRGNDSQVAAKLVLDKLPAVHQSKVKDMAGGLHAWAEKVDNNFPVY
ncbi:hypothetical protein HW555_010639 [Spodoptera exigua]|uniref:Ubiquitin activating enzyme 4 n=1 Tax=Spodoptera exigua TaxID=7107 RepID=A0A835GAB4_SPOEX|nr:hypothetical protein HW555_010639 [Spodoptera exigua]